MLFHSSRFLILFLAIFFSTQDIFSITLDSVFARGDSCVNVEWLPDSRNTRPDWYIKYGSKCTDVDSIYRHSDFLSGIPYRSIAYSYGGEDPYYTFSSKVKNGFLVGSHLCHYNTFGDPSPVIAGTDCSGFVCYVWDVPRTSTGGLIDDTHFVHIARNDLAPGDILVKSGSHCVLIIEKDAPGRFVIWESTSAVNGVREQVVNVNVSPWINYVPLRNPKVNSTSILNRNMQDDFSQILFLKIDRNKIHLNTGKNNIAEINIFSLKGDLIFSKKDFTSGNQSVILLQSFRKGMYVAKATLQNGIFITKQFVLK